MILLKLSTEETSSTTVLKIIRLTSNKLRFIATSLYLNEDNGMCSCEDKSFIRIETEYQDTMKIAMLDIVTRQVKGGYYDRFSLLSPNSVPLKSTPLICVR